MAGRRRAAADVLPPQSERSFQEAVLELAGVLQWRTWHDNATNVASRCRDCGSVRRRPRNVAGLPDLILVRRPRVIFAELKAEGRYATPEQQAWLADLVGCNVEVYLWRPSDFDEITRVLR